MFRRVLTAGAKIAGGLASVQMGAAAVALTDKQLSKKSEWYQNAVRSLEESLKKLSTYAYIESKEVLDNAEEILKKVHDIENAEILWRLARVLTEKASLSHNHEEQKKLLHDAIKYAKKAVALGDNSAGAHKWYAITIAHLLKVEKLPKSSVNELNDSILKHLKKATELDPKDPFAWHLLGVQEFNNKEYKEAVKHFEKAESIKAGFSAANLFYLGETQRQLGKKNEAIETLKKALLLPVKFSNDGKGKSEAKRILLTKLKQKAEDIEPKSDF